MREKIGLALEGGGMRGLFTAGVLDSLLENDIYTDYVIGVSAGACNGVSYVSKQIGRNHRINTEYLKDKRYSGLYSLITTKSIFGMDFLFNEIPEKLDIFDYDAFIQSPCEFVAGVTDLETGKPVYFSKEHIDHDSTVLRASSSIPVFSPAVEYNGRKYLDGGTTDPIPVRQAFRDGCKKVIVVLTRDRNFVRMPEKYRTIYKRIFRNSSAMTKALDKRHMVYNKTLDCIKKLEKSGKIIVIAPEEPIKISRFEKDKGELDKIYKMGKETCDKLIPEIKKFIVK